MALKGLLTKVQTKLAKSQDPSPFCDTAADVRPEGELDKDNTQALLQEKPS